MTAPARLCKAIASFGMLSIASLSPASSQNLQFYCDIKRTHQCGWESCKPIVQPLQPARYKFNLDIANGRGEFQSCPGGRCGGPYKVTASQLGGTGIIRVVYGGGDETFLFDSELKYFTHTTSMDPHPDGNGAFHAGTCSIDR